MGNRTVIAHDELVNLLQDGKINFLQYVMSGENAQDYLEWCIEKQLEPSADSAELYCEYCEIDMLEHQHIDDEYDGVW